MKKIKTLLTMLLCAVMIFGMSFCVTNVPVNAEVIEEDKPTPTEPKEVLMDLSFSKKIYHLNEKVILNLKFNDYPEEDIKKIDKIAIYEKGFIYCTFTSNDYDYNSKQFSIVRFDGTSTPLEADKTMITSEAEFDVIAKEGEDLSNYHFKNNIKTPVTAVFNDNCANNIHTVYKDDWKVIKKPTCENNGQEVRYCNICGEITDSRIIPKTNHVKSIWYVTKDPTIYSNGTKIIMCDIYGKVLQSQVIPKLPSTKQLKFTKKSITLKKGRTITLKYIRKPLNAQDKLSWKSSNSKIVKIIKNGKIKAVKKGKAVITLSTNTKKKAKITIKVK